MITALAIGLRRVHKVGKGACVLLDTYCLAIDSSFKLPTTPLFRMFFGSFSHWSSPMKIITSLEIIPVVWAGVQVFAKHYC